MENENKNFGFGTENQQESTNQSFGATQNDQSFGTFQSFGATQNDQQFGGQPDQQFGAAQNDQNFGTSQSFGGQTYGQPDQQFGATQNDQNFGTSQSFGGQTYGQPDQSFGTSQSFGGQTYGQPNQQFGYNSNMGYGMGTAPLDANGQPMKNNFGMKMTFSILEILTCCGCNVLTMVMGIIGCVFTTKANNSYKEGRWEDFKSQAKSATISLWIGFGFFIIGTILTIALWTAGGLGDEIMGEYNGSTSTNSHGSSHGTADNATLDGDVRVYVDDECISVPLDFEELEEMGYHLSSSDSNEIIDSGEFGLYAIMNSKGERVMWVWLYNYDSSDAYADECTVIGIDVDYYCENIDDYSTSEGLGFDNTREDFLEVYGTPDEETGEEFMCWYLGDGEDSVWQVMEVTFIDGELYDIDIDYGY